MQTGTGLPVLSWHTAGAWLPGPAVLPPPPPPPRPGGYSVAVIERNVGPTGGGEHDSSLVEQEAGHSVASLTASL